MYLTMQINNCLLDIVIPNSVNKHPNLLLFLTRQWLKQSCYYSAHLAASVLSRSCLAFLLPFCSSCTLSILLTKHPYLLDTSLYFAPSLSNICPFSVPVDFHTSFYSELWTIFACSFSLLAVEVALARLLKESLNWSVGHTGIQRHKTQAQSQRKG